jgi:hypothetical protein
MANYVKQTWTDNVTPVDKSHMDTIENGIFAAVPADAVTAAATRVVQNLLAGADAQPAFKIVGDGTHSWGPGGATAPDTVLGRTTVGRLQLNGTGFWMNGGAFRALSAAASDGFNYRPATAGGALIDSLVGAEGFSRFWIDANGKLSWGTGAGAQDATLQRTAANTLTVNNTLRAVTDVYAQDGAATQVRIGNSSGLPSLAFGSALDTIMSRIAAGAFGFNGGLYVQAAPLGIGFSFNPASFVANNMAFQATVTGETVRWSVKHGGLMEWGPGGAAAVDTNLYRSAASELATDGTFNLTGAGGAGQRLYLYKLTNTRYGIGLGTADFRIFYASNGVLTFGTMSTTDGTTYTELERIDAAGKHWFGAALDTNLYRSSAGILKTDGQMQAVNGFQASSGSLELTLGSLYLYSNTAKIFLGAASDTNLYRAAAAVLKTDGALQVGTSTLTGGVVKTTTSAYSAGPPASPGDGDIWIATAVGVNGERWTFQYNAGSASAYKWEFLGGSDVEVEDDGTVTALSTTYVLGTAGTGSPQSLTLARGGDYLVGHACSTVVPAGGITCTIGMRATGVADRNGQQISAVAGTTLCATAFQTRMNGITAGGTITPVYSLSSTASGSMQMQVRKLWCRPVRIA